MSEYVLEVLDGDQAGTVVELTGPRLRIGRRPENDFVLRDEKCSGNHAEIVVEDGRHLLRDLGSTNGTTLDGKRVTELVLSAGDVFQLGRVRCCFRRAETAAGGTEVAAMAVGTIDASRLARSRRRGGSLVFGALFGLVLAAGAAWWFLSRGEGELPGVGGGAGARDQRPLVVPGNRLEAGVGDFEGESGWSLQASSDAQGFEPTAGRENVHSGVAAISASGPGGESASRARFALARTSTPVAVAAGQSLRLSAHVKTSGAAKVALRAWFTALGGDVADLRSGSAALAAADWTELSVALRVPRGADRVAIEVLALLPGAADSALVDDVALLVEGEAPALEASAGGVALIGSGASFRIDSSRAPLLLGVEPLVAADAGGLEGSLADLARRGLLLPSDAGATASVSALGSGDGFAIALEGVAGLRLLFPAASAAPRWRPRDGAFRAVDASFEATELAELLVGTADNRAMLVLEPPATLRGAPAPGAWSIELPGTNRFTLRVVFGPEALRALELEREARSAAERGRPGDALRTLAELVARYPHELATLAKASLLRDEIVAEQERRVDALLRAGDDAAFFEARVGFRRVLAELDALEAAYGKDQLVRGTALAALRNAVSEGIQSIEARGAVERAELLGAMSLAFERSGEGPLAGFVRSYVERRLTGKQGGR